jgi:hypothetical protein
MIFNVLVAAPTRAMNGAEITGASPASASPVLVFAKKLRLEK